jgi:hypothetical protein
MTTLFPLLAALAAAPAGTPAGGGAHGLERGGIQGECPAPQANAAGRIRTLLTTPFLAELKARFDLGTAAADDIQPLTNATDRETCRALWDAVRTGGTDLEPGDRVSFYRSGDRFFVPITRERPAAPNAVIRLDGYSSLDVYDAEYRLVGRFGA